MLRGLQPDPILCRDSSDEPSESLPVSDSAPALTSWAWASPSQGPLPVVLLSSWQHAVSCPAGIGAVSAGLVGPGSLPSPRAVPPTMRD